MIEFWKRDWKIPQIKDYMSATRFSKDEEEGETFDQNDNDARSQTINFIISSEWNYQNFVTSDFTVETPVTCLGFGKILVSENLGRFCAIVVSTILSGMLEDSSRAHSWDILKANSAVTADAENPFITLKLPFSARQCVSTFCCWQRS